MSKRTKVQQAQMEFIVYDLLINGYSWRNIIIFLEENHQYKRSNAEKIILKVLKSFKIKDQIEKEKQHDIYIEMYLNIYKQAVSDGKVLIAKMVLDSICRLQGFITTKVEGKIPLDYIVKFTE